MTEETCSTCRYFRPDAVALWSLEGGEWRKPCCVLDHPEYRAVNHATVVLGLVCGYPMVLPSTAACSFHEAP